MQTQFADADARDALPPELRLAASPGDQAEDAQQRVVSMQETFEAIDRGLRWLLAMQNRDGGWGAFDRNNDREFLCHVPFADHNAMIDPSTPDLTGRVLEALGRLGHRLGDAAVDRAVAYVRRTQNPDGSWFGRWGVNYVYGTWQSLAGLTAVGVPADDPAIVAGAQLAVEPPAGVRRLGRIARQLRASAPSRAGSDHRLANRLGADGPASRRPARPSGRSSRRAISAGHPENDGTWDEPEFTGTGFPRVFYLRYHYYPIYFPLLALSQWAVMAGGEPAEADRLSTIGAESS